MFDAAIINAHASDNNKFLIDDYIAMIQNEELVSKGEDVHAGVGFFSVAD